MSQRDRYLVLKAAEFVTEDDANRFLPNLKVGLWNLALEYNIAFIPDFTLRQITRSADPEAAGRNLAKSFGFPALGPVHGLADEGGVTIYPIDQELKFISFGAGSGYVTTRLKDVIRVITEGIQTANADLISQDKRLATAIDLYLAHFYEQSQRARFLTLVMILEVMAPVTEKHVLVQEMISRWKIEIQERIKQQSDANALDALEALNRELEFRKETSIRRRVRQLILELALLDYEVRTELARRVISAYDLRGELVHSGTVDDGQLREALDVILKTVKLLLRARLGFDVKPS